MLTRSQKLGTTLTRSRAAAEQNYRVKEISRLLNEGVSLSKVAKLLDIPYSLAKTLKTLSTNKEG